MNPTRLMIIAMLLLLTLTACTPPEVGITVEDAWVRTSVVDSPMGDIIPLNDTVAYLRIRNNSSKTDILTGAESPAARVVEIYKTTMFNDVESTQSVTALEIPAGGEVSLDSGSYYLMLIDLQQALTNGNEVEITLIFERAGRVTVKAEVLE
ncbi:MAG: copper chaperone PCu(A)C [Bellilinea sp.]